jgi:(S)-ureidoglycine aminohydrolase
MTATRGARGLGYTLLTPENHYVSGLPSLPGAQIVKLVTPRMAPARLAQSLVRLPDAPLRASIQPGFETFLFGLSGDTRISWEGGSAALGARGYAYLPAGTGCDVESAGAGELLWVKRRYEPWPGLDGPSVAWGVAAEQAAMTATPGLRRQELLDPADPRRDFTMSLIAFQPGVGLPQIEIHDEEHGLWMTRGGGVYTLGGDEHAVLAGDFIYMAPYCPQGFAAGPDGAEYLLYKDVNRDGF